MLSTPATRAVILKASPDAGTRKQDPRHRVPAVSSQASRCPPTARFIEYNCVLSPAWLRGLSCRLQQTPAPAADTPISLRPLSRQSLHFAVGVDWRGGSKRPPKEKKKKQKHK